MDYTYAVSKETEEWDPEDNLSAEESLQSLSERGIKTSEQDLNYSFEGIEETPQIMIDG